MRFKTTTRSRPSKFVPSESLLRTQPTANTSSACERPRVKVECITLSDSLSDASSSSPPPPPNNNNNNNNNNTDSATAKEALTAARAPSKRNAGLDDVECVLENRDIWSKFNALTNEMRVMKSGQLLHPPINVMFRNLNPDARYKVALDFELADGRRYMYARSECRWVDEGAAVAPKRNHIYVHPDSPFGGAELMSRLVSFDKVKLVNQGNEHSNLFALTPMHRYRPRVHLFEFKLTTAAPRPSENAATEATCGAAQPRASAYYDTNVYSSGITYRTQVSKPSRRIFRFAETAFLAVSNFYNEQVRCLKASTNPSSFRAAIAPPTTRLPIGSHSATTDAPVAARNERSTTSTLQSASSTDDDEAPCDRVGPVRCSLENSDKWLKFQTFKAEMRVDKGRPMNPIVEVRFSNLDPTASYKVYLDIVAADDKRYRYSQAEFWQVAGDAETLSAAAAAAAAKTRNRYLHPSTPARGSQLAGRVIAFDGVRLTNQETDLPNHIVLRAKHRYQPRVHLVRCDLERARPNESRGGGDQLARSDECQSKNAYSDKLLTFAFAETVFFAVTVHRDRCIANLRRDSKLLASKLRVSSRGPGDRDVVRFKHLIDLAAASTSGGASTSASALDNAECVLVNKDLWDRFNAIGTEMRVDAFGIRMYPFLKVQFNDLDPHAYYAIALDIVPADNHRYRYMSSIADWVGVGPASPALEPHPYPAPGCPFSGEQLILGQVVSFDKVKLTYDRRNMSGHQILNPMHRYQLRVHLIELKSSGSVIDRSSCTVASSFLEEDSQLLSRVELRHRTFTFAQATFFAVKSHRNDKIMDLKKSSCARFRKYFVGNERRAAAAAVGTTKSVASSSVACRSETPPPTPGVARADHATGGSGGGGGGLLVREPSEASMDYEDPSESSTPIETNNSLGTPVRLPLSSSSSSPRLFSPPSDSDTVLAEPEVTRAPASIVSGVGAPTAGAARRDSLFNATSDLLPRETDSQTSGHREPQESRAVEVSDDGRRVHQPIRLRLKRIMFGHRRNIGSQHERRQNESSRMIGRSLEQIGKALVTIGRTVRQIDGRRARRLRTQSNRWRAEFEE